MNQSTVKTWFARAGFKPIGWRSNTRNWLRTNRCCMKSGRPFRVRHQGEDWVVDVGETAETFDRWANSTVTTLSLKCFMHHVQQKTLATML